METKKEKGKGDLKEIILSDDSNLILPEVSLPSTYQAQGEIKYGAKSNDQKLASEHDLLEYRKRVSRDATLTSDEIKTLVSETNERRRTLQQAIAEQKEQFQQGRIAELQARHIKEREEARAHRIANENETQKEIRLAAEEEIKASRIKEIQALNNKCKKEKEQVTLFFEQSTNRFNEKYSNPLLHIKISGETGIDRIISSRPFSTNRFAHRCTVCGYHNPESLSISKIYQHLYDDKKHMQSAFIEIDRFYNAAIHEARRKHAEADNLDLKHQKLSKDIENLKKLKGAKYR